MGYKMGACLFVMGGGAENTEEKCDLCHSEKNLVA